MAGCYGSEKEDLMRSRELDEYLARIEQEEDDEPKRCESCSVIYYGDDAVGFRKCEACGRELCDHCFSAHDSAICKTCREDSVWFESDKRKK